jgi:hypothetical protein
VRRDHLSTSRAQHRGQRKLQYDVDQIEHYRHPRVLHVAEFVCPQGHIATSRRVFTSVDDKPAEEEERGESAE